MAYDLSVKWRYIYMPIFLAILSLASGLQRARAGDKIGGLAQMFSAGRSFGNLTNNFSAVPEFHSFGETDAGVRRNYM